MSGELKRCVLPSFLQSIRCKQKAVDRWLADVHVTLLTSGANGFVLMII